MKDMNSVSSIDSKVFRAEACSLGFFAVGFSPAQRVDAAVEAAYRHWIEEGHQGDMHYLENYLDMRFDPRVLVPGARTVISLLLSYHPYDQPTQPALSWYAQGQDYHDVLRERLSRLMEQFSLTGRYFTDSAPVLDRYWAWRSGLGFIGRHTQLVVPRLGSAFFIGELIVAEQADLYDSPLTPSYFHNLCGRCRRCVDACPMDAIQMQGPLLARRCLSYLSIEQRGAIPDEAREHLKECFYGCDRCVRACPHLHAQEPPVPELQASEQLLTMQSQDWDALTQEQFQMLFRHSAVRRAKYSGLRRNIEQRKRD